MAIWIARTIAAIALVIFVLWAYREPRFDSIGGAFVALTALVSLFVVPKLRTAQNQKVSNGSFGVQAGGNANVGNVSQGNSQDDRRKTGSDSSGQ